MKTFYLVPSLVLGMALSACAPAATKSSTPTEIVIAPAPQPTQTVPTPQPSVVAGVTTDIARSDAQGAVQFKVTPLNLAHPGETFDFDVDMNTH
ncbi:MAG TPA: hypothetical protein VGK87_17680, partial [Anaerolineae bacterium]